MEQTSTEEIFLALSVEADPEYDNAGCCFRACPLTLAQVVWFRDKTQLPFWRFVPVLYPRQVSSPGQPGNLIAR